MCDVVDVEPEFGRLLLLMSAQEGTQGIRLVGSKGTYSGGPAHSDFVSLPFVQVLKQIPRILSLRLVFGGKCHGECCTKR